jgi:drug/metabolite transporter (DMT)-like permease
MLACAAGFAVMAYFVKKLGHRIPPFETVFFRSLVNLVCMTIWMRATRHVWKPVSRRDLSLLGLRATAGFVSLCCYFYSLQNLPLSIAGLVSWTSPLFVAVFSALFLGERLPPRALLCIGGAFAGLVLLLAPGQVGLADLSGVTLAIGFFGAACAGAAYVTVRAASRRLSPNLIVFGFVFLATLASLPLAAAQYVQPTWADGWELLAMGLAATWGQVAMTRAYQHAPAGIVSAMGLLTAVFSALLGVWAFGETLAVEQWLGIVVVVGSLAWLRLLG